jgi:hypothetical protein
MGFIFSAVFGESHNFLSPKMGYLQIYGEWSFSKS